MPPGILLRQQQARERISTETSMGALSGTGKGYLVFSLVERKVEVAAFSFRGNPKSATPSPLGARDPIVERIGETVAE
jgi:hypothetical protein